jgi:hypothetical protein
MVPINGDPKLGFSAAYFCSTMVHETANECERSPVPVIQFGQSFPGSIDPVTTRVLVIEEPIKGQRTYKLGRLSSLVGTEEPMQGEVNVGREETQSRHSGSLVSEIAFATLPGSAMDVCSVPISDQVFFTVIAKKALCV